MKLGVNLLNNAYYNLWVNLEDDIGNELCATFCDAMDTKVWIALHDGLGENLGETLVAELEILYGSYTETD